MELAVRLRRAGVRWRPASGDRFVLPDRGLDDEVFVLSTMVVDVHDRPEGQVIGFNGTVEWALDDVEKDEAVWLPTEEQLREMLGSSFRGLSRDASGYRVVAELSGERISEGAEVAADAYARAVLRMIRLLRDEHPEPVDPIERRLG
jgi:hypothetical protein